MVAATSSGSIEEFAAWFAGKEFSSDWTSHNFPIWSAILGSLRDKPLNILEIGSWEGRSAVFFMEFFPHAKITCIDTFAGGVDIGNFQDQLQIPKIEQRFDRNLAPYGDRVTKLKARSATALDMLNKLGQRYDLVLIDGSHQRDDVLIDSLLAWRLTNDAAIIIWDDYAGGSDKPDAEKPRPAVDLFLGWYKAECRLLLHDYQVIVQRQTAK